MGDFLKRNFGFGYTPRKTEGRIPGRFSGESPFKKHRYLTRPQVGKGFKSTSREIPGMAKWVKRKGGGKGLEREIFGREYGSFIDRREMEKKMRELNKGRLRAKTFKEREDLTKKAKLLKGFKGEAGPRR